MAPKKTPTKTPKTRKSTPTHTEQRTAVVVQPSSPRLTEHPAINPPRRLVLAMDAAGAENDEDKGESVRIVRIPGLDSPAWEVYKQWCISAGLVKPQAVAACGYDPTSANAPPIELAYPIQQETNSIINHLKDFPMGGPVPTQLPDPLQHPVMYSNIRDAGVAVTTLLDVLRDPPANYPAVHSLKPGTHICELEYSWQGTLVTVPIYKAG